LFWDGSRWTEEPSSLGGDAHKPAFRRTGLLGNAVALVLISALISAGVLGVTATDANLAGVTGRHIDEAPSLGAKYRPIGTRSVIKTKTHEPKKVTAQRPATISAPSSDATRRPALRPSKTQRDAYRARVDREAAAIILQDELDSRRATGFSQIRPTMETTP